MHGGLRHKRVDSVSIDFQSIYCVEVGQAASSRRWKLQAFSKDRRITSRMKHLEIIELEIIQMAMIIDGSGLVFC